MFLRRAFGYRRKMETIAASRGRVWPAAVLAAAAVLLVPWAIALNMTLPSRQIADHWDIAWTGFDVMLAGSLLVTAYLAWRESEALRPVAAVSGTLLACDAWFDVLTASTGTDLGLALVLAIVAEIPLAILCFLLATGTVESLPRPKAALGFRRSRLL